MGKNLATRSGFIVAVLLFFIYGIFGIPHGGLVQSLKNRINLGLDLKGGTHLVLQVHVAEAVNSSTDRDVQSLNTALAATGATASKQDLAHPETITISGGSLTQQSAIHDVLTGNEYVGYDVNSSGNGGYTMTLKQATIRDIETRALDTSIDTITNRINKLGVSEPFVGKYGLGDNEILVQLPGVSDPGRVENIIQSTAKLEIHAVVGSYGSLADANAANPGGIPAEDELLKGSNGVGGPDEYYLLKRLAIVEGTDFRDAQPSTDENGRPDITFNLTTAAGDRFYKYTDANKGTGSMAIVLDNQVKEVAGIEGAIRDTGRITGGFTPDQAGDLSLMLRTGSLPASISYLETRTVGATLGTASIHQGVVASIAGLAVVLIFMLIYYKGAGVNA
ncbi:MAG TPA: protein translocase subunit SecD, partial [Acidobacteriaceae bacterium]